MNLRCFRQCSINSPRIFITPKVIPKKLDAESDISTNHLPRAQFSATAFIDPTTNAYREFDLEDMKSFCRSSPYGFRCAENDGGRSITITPDSGKPEEQLLVYNFGVMIYVNVDRFIKRKYFTPFLAQFIGPDCLEVKTTEDYAVVYKDNEPLGGKYAHASNDMIQVSVWTPATKKIIADVLAYSAALTVSRKIIESTYKQFGSLLESQNVHKQSSWVRIKNDWVYSNRKQDLLLRYMLRLNKFHLFLNKELGHVEWYDKAWSDVAHDDVHEAMLSEFVIKTRFNNQNRRIEFIHSHFKAYYEIGSSKEATISEKFIVLLFSIEILLTVYDLLFLR